MLAVLTITAGGGAAVLAAPAIPAGASVVACTWTGGGGTGNENWSDSANWGGGAGCTGTGTVPGSGDWLDFPAAPTQDGSTDDIGGLTGITLSFENGVNATVSGATGVVLGLASGLGATGTGAISDSSAKAVSIDVPLDIAPTSQAAPVVDNSGTYILVLGGTISSTVTPTAPLTVVGGPSATTELQGANTYAGGTVVTSFLLFGNSSGLGTGSVTVGAGGTLQPYGGYGNLTVTNPLVIGDGTAGKATVIPYEGTDTWAGPVSLVAGTTDQLESGSGTGFDVTGTISGAAALTVGPGTVTFDPAAGSNTFSGGTDISYLGEAEVETGSALGTGTVTLENQSTLDLHNATSNAMAVANAITLATGAAATIADDTTLNSYDYVSGTIDLPTGTTLTASTPHGWEASGTISGGGSLVQSGGNYLELSGNNLYSGGTTITGNTIQADTLSAFGTGPVTVDDQRFALIAASGGTVANAFVLGSGSAGPGVLAVNGTGVTVSGAISLPTAKGGWIIGPGNAQVTFSGAISGLGPLTVGLSRQSGEDIVLSGANTYTGGTTVTGVGSGTITLIFTQANGLGSGPVAVQSGGVVAGLSSGGMSVGNAVTLGAGGGTGTLENGSSFPLTWTGTVTVPAGSTGVLTGTRLVVGGAVNSSGTLDLSSTAGSWIEIGGTVTGAAAVTGGTVDLLMSGVLAGVAVAPGAVLEGDGEAQAVSVGGEIIGGAGAPGVLLTAGLSLSATADFSVDLVGSTPGSGFSQVDSSGPVSLGGAALSIGATSPTTLAPGQSYDILVNSSGSSISGTFAGVPEGGTVPCSGMVCSVTYRGGSSGHDVVLTSLAADGSGTATVSPTQVQATTADNQVTFTYVAAAGGTDDGTVAVTVPSGWTPPTAAAGHPGYVTASGGTGADSVSATGQTITVSGVTLAGGGILRIVYGSGGGASGVTAPAQQGSSVFAVASATSPGGSRVDLASSPVVQVAAPPAPPPPPPPTQTVPGAPANVVATAGNASANLTWSAPTSDGGSAVTGYVVTPSSGSPVTVGDVTADTVTGLTNGTAYTFTVAAINAVGTGSASAISNSVTPSAPVIYGPPGAPMNVTATVVSGNDVVALQWNAPSNDGGSPITGYGIVASNGQKDLSGTGTTYDVIGLRPGSYSFRIYAINAYYDGAYSAASNQVTINGTVPTSATSGYWEVASDGGIFSYGNAGFHGSTGSLTLNKPIVGMAATPDGGGYWEVASDGGIFSYGNAGFHGSTGSLTLNKPIVGMAATPDGGGYWEVASDGGIFAFGDAVFHGSTGSLTLNKPIVGMAATPDGGGYWEVASDGGIFAFGDAVFHGSTGSLTLNKPIVGMAATPDGGGYWLVASDGGIFAFGDAGFHGSTGSLTLNKPIVGMAATPDGGGYWLVASDGGIFSYGNAGFHGSTGALTLNEPIVGMAA